jgi:hypothetical protein
VKGFSSAGLLLNALQSGEISTANFPSTSADIMEREGVFAMQLPEDA